MKLLSLIPVFAIIGCSYAAPKPLALHSKNEVCFVTSTALRGTRSPLLTYVSILPVPLKSHLPVTALVPTPQIDTAIQDLARELNCGVLITIDPDDNFHDGQDT